MRDVREPRNPWWLLCTWPGWRGLRDSLQDLELLLRTIGGEAADLADGVAAVLDDPVAARADLPANYRLRSALQKAERRLPAGFDLESECQGWIGEVARYACDVPVLLEASGTADALGRALTADLPRALQARFADVVQRLKQMLQGRKLRATPHRAEPPQALAVGRRPLRYVVPQADGFAVLLPLGAAAAELLAAWRELAFLLLERWGPDLVRLHLQLLASWPAEVSRDTVYGAMGMRRGSPERCYEAMRRLQRVRLSLYHWGLEEGTLTLEHQAQDLWTLRLREGGQAHLVEEGGALVARGREWWVTPGPHSWAATVPAGALDAELARLLLYAAEGARNPLSLALGLGLARGANALANREVLHLAGVSEQEAGLWRRVREAMRLQRALGWEADLSQWDRELGKRLREGALPDDWAQFLSIVTTFAPAMAQAQEEGAPAG